MSTSDGPSPYEEHLDLIEGILGRVASRRCLSVDEAEDFASWARIRLLEGDCAILRKFRGRSSFRTYLVTVTQNLFRDYRISKWGKFRPSAAARRLGTTAVRLEILLYRDGVPFEEAAEVLRRNHGVEESTAELARLAGRLPARTPTRPVGEDALEGVGDPGGAEDRVRDGERAALVEQVEELLAQALRQLDPEDRLILKMRFQDGLTVATISRTLDLDQKPLYRRIREDLKALRASLREDGPDPDAVLDLLGWHGFRMRVEYGE